MMSSKAVDFSIFPLHHTWKRDEGLCREKEVGTNHICPFIMKEKLSMKPDRRLLLMPLQPEPIRFTWSTLTGREVERKDLAFLASLVKNREWRRGWKMDFRLVIFQRLPHFSLYKH